MKMGMFGEWDTKICCGVVRIPHMWCRKGLKNAEWLLFQKDGRAVLKLGVAPVISLIREHYVGLDAPLHGQTHMNALGYVSLPEDFCSSQGCHEAVLVGQGTHIEVYLAKDYRELKPEKYQSLIQVLMREQEIHGPFRPEKRFRFLAYDESWIAKINDYLSYMPASSVEIKDIKGRFVAELDRSKKCKSIGYRFAMEECVVLCKRDADAEKHIFRIDLCTFNRDKPDDVRFLMCWDSIHLARQRHDFVRIGEGSPHAYIVFHYEDENFDPQLIF